MDRAMDGWMERCHALPLAGYSQATRVRDAGVERDVSRGGRNVAPPHQAHMPCVRCLYLPRLAQPLLGGVVAAHLGAAQDGRAPGQG